MKFRRIIHYSLKLTKGPCSFIYRFREHLVTDNPDETISTKLMGNLLSGGLAGACATAFIYPLDYARTR